jgi:phosphoribosylformylglycinamidine synthase
VNTKLGLKIFNALSIAVQKGYVRSMHDCSEGGIAVALAEMAFSGGWGVTARLDKVAYKGKSKRDDMVFFAESNSRFIVEVDPKNQSQWEQLLSGIPYGLIGRVEDTPEFIVYGLDKGICLNVFIQDLKAAWLRPLQWS